MSTMPSWDERKTIHPIGPFLDFTIRRGTSTSSFKKSDLCEEMNVELEFPIDHFDQDDPATFLAWQFILTQFDPFQFPQSPIKPWDAAVKLKACPSVDRMVEDALVCEASECFLGVPPEYHELDVD